MAWERVSISSAVAVAAPAPIDGKTLRGSRTTETVAQRCPANRIPWPLLIQ
jgi:hypothetical protein